MNAKNDRHQLSLFDKQHKLQQPSAEFDWEYIAANYFFDPNGVICEGELQELDPDTSQLHSLKYYAATSKELLRFSVKINNY